MERRLQYFGSRILRNRSEEVDVASAEEFLKKFVEQMFSVLRMENGLGLAAPQVGENLRLFILSPEEPSFMGHTVFINPVVEISGPFQKEEEGCLSIPGVYEFVKRPSSARVTALDLSGEKFTLDLRDYPARAVQHENDHLDGILFVDRLSPLRKKLVRKKLAEIKREYGPDTRIL